MPDMLAQFKSVLQMAYEQTPALVDAFPGKKFSMISASGFVKEINKHGLLVKSPVLVNLEKSSLGIAAILTRTLEFIIAQDLRLSIYWARKDKLEKRRWEANYKIFTKSMKATRFLARMKILETLFGGMGAGGFMGGAGVGAMGMLMARTPLFLPYAAARGMGITKRLGGALKFGGAALGAGLGIEYMLGRIRGETHTEALLSSFGDLKTHISVAASYWKETLTPTVKKFGESLEGLMVSGGPLDKLHMGLGKFIVWLEDKMGRPTGEAFVDFFKGETWKKAWEGFGITLQGTRFGRLMLRAKEARLTPSTSLTPRQISLGEIAQAERERVAREKEFGLALGTPASSSAIQMAIMAAGRPGAERIRQEGFIDPLGLEALAQSEEYLRKQEEMRQTAIFPGGPISVSPESARYSTKFLELLEKIAGNTEVASVPAIPQQDLPTELLASGLGGLD